MSLNLGVQISMVSLDGGEGEIRTLEPLLTVTRFPVVRPRPTRRLLQIFSCRYDVCSRRLIYHITNQRICQYLFLLFFIIFGQFWGGKNAATATVIQRKRILWDLPQPCGTFWIFTQFIGQAVKTARSSLWALCDLFDIP